MNLSLPLPIWLVSDSTKLLLFVLAIVALFLLMRVLSRRSESAPAHPFGNAQVLGDGEDSQVPDVHPAMRFGKVELRRFHMHEFDVMTGPPDPFEFVDELTAEIEHLDTGERSEWHFIIGTPSGFARLLERKDWESFYTPQIFVIRKYELEIVREMVIDHITSELQTKSGGNSVTER